MKSKKEKIYLICIIALAVFCVVFFAVKLATMTHENFNVTGSELLDGLLPSSYDMDVVCTGIKDDKLETLPYLYDFENATGEPEYNEMALDEDTKYFSETRTSVAGDDNKIETSVEYKSLTKSEFMKLFAENDTQYLYIWTENGTDCDTVMVYYEQSNL